MTATELIARQLEQALGALKSTLADFTDQEMLARPCDSANHPMWQLGHLCVAEALFGNIVKPGTVEEPPEDFKARFGSKATAVNDLSKLATKQELLDLFARNRQANIAMVRSLNQSDLDKPGAEMFKDFAPTIGDTLMVLVTHQMMHMGQMQAARRKLGKKILF